MSPEEREFEREEAYERDLHDIEVAEMLADEQRSTIDWPEPITVYPVELSAPEFT